jgi:hypothetical protein
MASRMRSRRHRARRFPQQKKTRSLPQNKELREAEARSMGGARPVKDRHFLDGPAGFCYCFSELIGKAARASRNAPHSWAPGESAAKDGFRFAVFPPVVGLKRNGAKSTAASGLVWRKVPVGPSQSRRPPASLRGNDSEMAPQVPGIAQNGLGKRPPGGLQRWRPCPRPQAWPASEESVPWSTPRIARARSYLRSKSGSKMRPASAGQVSQPLARISLSSCPEAQPA